jgi:hypothetical protein
VGLSESVLLILLRLPLRSGMFWMRALTADSDSLVTHFVDPSNVSSFGSAFKSLDSFLLSEAL